MGGSRWVKGRAPMLLPEVWRRVGPKPRKSGGQKGATARPCGHNLNFLGRFRSGQADSGQRTPVPLTHSAPDRPPPPDRPPQPDRPPPPDPPKISRFLFPSPRSRFHYFFLFVVSSRGISAVFEALGTLKSARLEFSGCRVRPPGAFTRQLEGENKHI